MSRKNTIPKAMLSVFMVVLMSISLVACNQTLDAVSTDTTEATEALNDYQVFWQDAEYTEDTFLGQGETQFEFQVIVGENSVTFTVSTDSEILGDALLECDLIAGEESEYGLYVKEVNGITADYDVNGYYWSFSKDGEMMMTGVDGETIESGAHYEMTCTK